MNELSACGPLADEPRRSLHVSTATDACEAPPGGALAFGRAAALVLDVHNPRLHRVAGRFVHLPACGWALENRCRTATMVLTDDDGGSYARLAAGRTMPLPFADSSLAFEAGRHRYRLHVRAPSAGHGVASRLDGPPPGTPTLPHMRCPALNDDQAALLALLVAPRLLGPVTAARLPRNVELAERLGWTLPKLNRKLDHLCAKFARSGIDGLLPDERGRCATERRLRLVDAIVENGWQDALAPGRASG